MEDIKFVSTPKCKDCMTQLENSSMKQLSGIIEERKQRPTCHGCNRLDNFKTLLRIKGLLEV